MAHRYHNSYFINKKTASVEVKELVSNVTANKLEELGLESRPVRLQGLGPCLILCDNSYNKNLGKSISYWL